MTSFYYSATVRVAEEESSERLSSSAWFRNALPEVQRQWRGAQQPSDGIGVIGAEQVRALVDLD